MRIYLAGPLFCEAERTFNAQLAARLEAIGFSVFLPQRDGVESWTLADKKFIRGCHEAQDLCRGPE